MLQSFRSQRQPNHVRAVTVISSPRLTLVTIDPSNAIECMDAETGATSRDIQPRPPACRKRQPEGSSRSPGTTNQVSQETKMGILAKSLKWSFLIIATLMATSVLAQGPGGFGDRRPNGGG